MAKILVVDRIEEDIAVCENRDNKRIFNIRLSRLPEGTREGTVLKYSFRKFTIEEQLQKEIEQRIEEKMNDIWEN